MSEEAKAKLAQVIPFLRDAMATAAKEGEPQIGILALAPGGKGGRVVCQFRAGEFVNDLCDALGLARANTEDERLNVAAHRINEMVRNAGGTIECTPLLPSEPQVKP